MWEGEPIGELSRADLEAAFKRLGAMCQRAEADLYHHRRQSITFARAALHFASDRVVFNDV